MRQLGTLENQRDAERFAAWLVAQRIEAQAEQEDAAWVVWVRDEDQLLPARAALAHYREHPQDPRYSNAERSAAELLRQDEAKRREAQKNVVQMRSRWGNPAAGIGGATPRRCPLVLTLIALSLLVSILTSFGKEPAGGLLGNLLFVDPVRAIETPPSGPPRATMWASIYRGEFWRLVTPIFIHFDWMHLIFNALVFYSFGGQIENRRGSLYFAGLVLILAVTSNLGQALEATVREHVSRFGGLSGVGYGLFGYLLVKTKSDNRAGYLLSPVTSFILLLFFFLCIGGAFPPLNSVLPESLTHVANSAHAVGLVVGAAWAYAPLVLRKPA